jgi:hypothetical protein
MEFIFIRWRLIRETRAPSTWGWIKVCSGAPTEGKLEPSNSGLGDLAVSGVAIDPQDSNTMYAGTDAGLFVITLAP